MYDYDNGNRVYNLCGCNWCNIMSEYLTRLKQLRDATPPPGNAPNVQSNVSFRKAIDYIEKLEAERMPEELFSAYPVYENLPPNVKDRLPPVCVSDVLDTIVKLIKERINNV